MTTTNIDVRPGVWTRSLPKSCHLDRDSTILALCEGKRVLHLGAADAGFHRSKARVGKLLHQKLQRVAAQVVGIDNNQEAIRILRDEFGVVGIDEGDGTLPLNGNGEFDIVLCCDIIEHVDSPIELVRHCRNALANGGTLVLTTINGPALKVGLRALQGREAVHTDHVAYYSLSTLVTLLARLDMHVSACGYFEYGCRTSVAGWLFGLIHRLQPGTSDGILLLCQKN